MDNVQAFSKKRPGHEFPGIAMKPSTTHPRSEKYLAIILRIAGGVMLLAFAAALLPFEWMGAIHRWLGLGELPRAPIVEYLARTASLLYGFNGCLLLFLGRDPRRHAALILFIGALSAPLSVAVFIIDVAAGMPWSWTLGEGPPVLILAVAIVLLARPLLAGDGSERK